MCQKLPVSILSETSGLGLTLKSPPSFDSAPHPLFILALFTKVCLLTFCTVLIKLMSSIDCKTAESVEPFNISIDHQMSVLHHFAPLVQRWIIYWPNIFHCGVAEFCSPTLKARPWRFSTTTLKWWSAQSLNTLSASFLALISVHLSAAYGGLSCL